MIFLLRKIVFFLSRKKIKLFAKNFNIELENNKKKVKSVSNSWEIPVSKLQTSAVCRHVDSTQMSQ